MTTINHTSLRISYAIPYQRKHVGIRSGVRLHSTGRLSFEVRIVRVAPGTASAGRPVESTGRPSRPAVAVLRRAPRRPATASAAVRATVGVRSPGRPPAAAPRAPWVRSVSPWTLLHSAPAYSCIKYKHELPGPSLLRARLSSGRAILLESVPQKSSKDVITSHDVTHEHRVSTSLGRPCRLQLR